MAPAGTTGYEGGLVERGSIACKVKGRVLKQSQVTLVVSSKAGDSHQVGGEFAQDYFELFMR